jgi:hypothetical protein
MVILLTLATWGILSQPVNPDLTGAFGKIKGEIPATMPELLRYAYIS